jgi:hypothetical protein
MAKTVEITGLTGATPFDIWVCESCSPDACQYIDTIETGDLPYSFSLPVYYESLSTYTIRIIDDNKCIICNTF